MHKIFIFYVVLYSGVTGSVYFLKDTLIKSISNRIFSHKGHGLCTQNYSIISIISIKKEQQLKKDKFG